jgi:FkbM family methyltransferase
MNRTILRLRKLLRLLVRPWSWSALRHGVGPSIEHERILKSLADQGIRTVVDVGANVGQFTAVCRHFLPNANVFAFEPLAEPSNKFHRVHGRDSRVRLDQRALGADAVTLAMNVSASADSSSLLPISDRQEKYFPGTRAQSTEMVEVVRFDSLPICANLELPVLVKLDVQGFELAALKGFGDALDSVQYIYLELSLLPFYTGQSLAADIVAYLSTKGFEIADIGDLTRGTCGEVLQFDALLSRRSDPLNGIQQ